MTRYEVKLWLRLRALKEQGFRFRRQVPINRWIVDFACLSNRVIVEVDGMQHGFDKQERRDAVRDAFFLREGFSVLRFTNGEVWENIDGVVATIFERRSLLNAMRSDCRSFSRPPPDPSLREGPPSPQGGGRKKLS